MQSNDFQEEQSSNFDFKEIFFKYLSYFHWLVLGAIIGLTISFFYLRYATEYYQSSSVIKVLDNNNAGFKLPSDGFSFFAKSRINLEKIDFLSIDTEGTELEVLMGFDINRWKPRLFVIENNFGESKFSDYLRDFGYKFSQRIGVNDFFISGEEIKGREEQKSDSPQGKNLDHIFEI